VTFELTSAATRSISASASAFAASVNSEACTPLRVSAAIPTETAFVKGSGAAGFTAKVFSA
jgi:hypothetical protein